LIKSRNNIIKYEFFMKKLLILSLFIGISMICSNGYCVADEPPPATEEGFLQWVREKFGEVEISDAPFIKTNFIKGKVVDYNENPISGVEITAGWFYTKLLTMEQGIEEQTILTDSEGLFFIETTTSDPPMIREIKKKGYEYNYDDNPFFHLSSNEERERVLRSLDDPIKFYLRELGPTTYLYEYGYNWYVKKETEVISYDAIARRIREVSPDLGELKKPEFIDLVLSSAHDTAEGTYTVRLTAPLETNGMQVSDTKFYEAPADGYARELTLNFNHGDEVTKYIYFTSRIPAVYSRMEVACEANPERLTFSFDTWTNPYGSRILELEPDLPWSLEGQLEREAISSLKNGTLQPEPDIPALLASGKYE
jgi:hypothetical protein